MKLLVTGGAGYVGSVVTARWVEGGHEVTVLDADAWEFTRNRAEGRPRT